MLGFKQGEQGCPTGRRLRAGRSQSASTEGGFLRGETARVAVETDQINAFRIMWGGVLTAGEENSTYGNRKIRVNSVVC